MQYIVVDFEMARDGRRGASHIRSELIEIGAVKINEAYEVIGEYKRFIRPETMKIAQGITKLTGISNEMVASEQTFLEVTMDFLDWIGEEETTIYSWSMADLTQLQGESERKALKDERLERLFANWMDLQKEFGMVLGVEQNIKLSYALKAANIEFEGREHDGLADAMNTAKLFILSRDQEELKKRMSALIEMFQPKETLSSSFASFLPKGLLFATDDKEKGLQDV